MKLDLLGYDDYIRESIKETDKVPARVLAEHKEAYIVITEYGEYPAKVKGKLMYDTWKREDYPAVGDWVTVSIEGKELAVIYEVLPRKSLLKRKSSGSSEIQVIAANIDYAFIVQTLDRDFSLNRIERYIAIVKAGGIEPVIVISKSDLEDENEIETRIFEITKRFNDADLFVTSSVSGKGIEALKDFIKEKKTYCFLGSSGVGKSTLINALLGDSRIKTKKISSKTKRGRHSTTNRQLFVLDTGGLLIDNPGMREIGIIDSLEGIKDVFSEIEELKQKCRFVNCTHIHEPGCEIIKAAEEGIINKGKYDNYIKLVKENEYNSLTNLEKREKDRKFGKFIKKTKKDIKKYKYNEE